MYNFKVQIFEDFFLDLYGLKDLFFSENHNPLHSDVSGPTQADINVWGLSLLPVSAEEERDTEQTVS